MSPRSPGGLFTGNKLLVEGEGDQVGDELLGAGRQLAAVFGTKWSTPR
jgi:hypothetical protein